MDECIALAQKNLSKIPRDSHFASGALLNIFTICLTTQGRFSEVIELAASAKNHMAYVSRELGLLHSERVNAVASFAPGRLRSARVGLVYSRCVDGIISFTQGRLRAAREQFETAFRFASQRNRYSSSSAVAAIYLAETWYEENNLVAAEEMLREYLTLIRQTGLPDHIISAHRILGRIAITQDKLAEAHFQLREMESLGLERGLGRVVSSARLEKARLALIQGDLELAEHVFHQEETAKEWGKAISGVPHANELDDSKLFKIRLLIKRGNCAEALGMVQQELKIIPQTTTSRRGLLLKLLTAVAMDCSGDELAAQKNLIEVLEFVALEGNKRLIADENYLLGGLFRTLLNKEISRTPGVDLLLKELAGDLESGDDAAETESAPPAQAAIDELTRRELQVLTLVAEGLTNRDMANKLFLSEVTIKTHMRNISSKLGVHSRTQAIIIARKRNLI
ncbi:MAG: LuxR C-terminal-related transcriptional regulator [Proteobacteria bacterium]|nr:LuxR C-terminal-related transcriptional regulator [Pseudomonadota bacterium]